MKKVLVVCASMLIGTSAFAFSHGHNGSSGYRGGYGNEQGYQNHGYNDGYSGYEALPKKKKKNRAFGSDRIRTWEESCAFLQQVVASSRRGVILQTSETTWDRYRPYGVCSAPGIPDTRNERLTPARVPSIETFQTGRQCFVGYTCENNTYGNDR